MFFDAHADILTDMYQEHLKGDSSSFKTRHLTAYKTAGITHSIFVNWTDPTTTDASLFDTIFNYAFQELDNHQDIFHVIKNVCDIDESASLNKIGVIIGMEGIHQLRDVNHLRELYQKGVRHAGLTWNEVNRYAAGLSSETEGLTIHGQDILHEMEQLGMIIDLAHANERTFQDIFNHTTQPLIISHGNTKSVCDHIRNYTDSQLIQLQQRGGVIGVCGIKQFISSEPSGQTVEGMVDHIDYIVSKIGINHVGLGLDICYYLRDINVSNGVDGLQTIADAPNIIIELKKRGYSDTEIEKITYGNFMRVIRTILR
ncbi:dipeptidase [Candidatus Xianfuyuplasma coldseepsis]|uniref:Membrane dipeptidase n=1 Tax=Candidatus Xianfuyuplasma coldseepsis TaxID=2782163 RepID=A0A7L7KPN5_9MOLU|nr:membrane dipeptidase [Xianfuyuplasma coldseepsis]QMS84202.1 membrane dipeptidase [Xianfuyuplasma coldseepsis]